MWKRFSASTKKFFGDSKSKDGRIEGVGIDTITSTKQHNSRRLFGGASRGSSFVRARSVPTRSAPIESIDRLPTRSAIQDEAEQLELALALSLSQEEETPTSASHLGSGSRLDIPMGEQNHPSSHSCQHASAPRSSMPLPGTPGSAQRTNVTVDGDIDPTAQMQENALLNFSEIVANCEQTRQSFVDPGFVPGPQVLYVNGNSRRRDANELAVVRHFGTTGGDIQWLSAGQILQRPDDLQMQFETAQEMRLLAQQFASVVEWRVFQSDPSATDISQGGLGNCWFCGSLAAVAEKPQLIRRLFVDPYSQKGDLSPKGVYVVRLCDGGAWHFEIIDGLLPCSMHRTLAFSGARRNQLWVPLLEKAYAKLRKTYEAIEGGNPAEGLRLFTGWPSIVQELHVDPNHQSETVCDADERTALRTQAVCPFAGEDVLWTRLVSAYESKLIICGSCGHIEGISNDQYRAAGLSPSHCYSIVRVVSALEGNLRLLQLRNPWGTGRKWNGQFSDTDIESWTPELKAEVGAEDLGEEGVFWMALQDIRRYFTSITVCPYQEGWAEARRTLTMPVSAFKGQQPAILLSSACAVEALLSCMQPEEKSSPTTMTADIGLAIFRLPRSAVPRQGQTLESLEGGGATLVDTTDRRVQDTLVCDYMITSDDVGSEPDAVLVVPLSFNQRCSTAGEGGNDKSICFACFSPHPVIVRSLAIGAYAHREALVAHVRCRGSRRNFGTGATLYKSTEAGLVIYVENKSPEVLLFETDLTNLFNVTISRGMEATADGEQYLFTRDTVPPMHGMVILVAAAMPAGHTYHFASNANTDRSGGRDVHEPPLAEPLDALHTPFFLEGRSYRSGR